MKQNSSLLILISFVHQEMPAHVGPEHKINIKFLATTLLLLPKRWPISDSVPGGMKRMIGEGIYLILKSSL